MKAISTKYLPITANKPLRLKAWHQEGFNITISVDRVDEAIPQHRELNDARTETEDYQRNLFIALALRDKMKWKGKMVGGSVKGGYVFVFVP